MSGYRASAPNQVAAFVVPKPNMRFNHKAHLDRQINCAQCHGSIDELELATRDQLPRMKGCFGCHNMSGPAQGQAKSDCNVCHVTETSGQLKTMFATGALQPPRWLGNAQHGPDFIERHKRVAADNSALCSSCHKENFCSDCHDGKVRPNRCTPTTGCRCIPSPHVKMRPSARAATKSRAFASSATSARASQGRVARTLPLETMLPSTPPGWGDLTGRGPGHHSWEAQRNLNACVSCHTERDCIKCQRRWWAASGARRSAKAPTPRAFLPRVERSTNATRARASRATKTSSSRSAISRAMTRSRSPRDARHGPLSSASPVEGPTPGK